MHGHSSVLHPGAASEEEVGADDHGDRLGDIVAIVVAVGTSENASVRDDGATAD